MEHILQFMFRDIIQKRSQLSAEFSAIFICLKITFRHNENLEAILMRKENVQI